MFAPTKIWRRWHRKINQNQRRFATASALAASALPALVMARGHRVNGVNEVPCVVSDSIETVTKTKDAISLLKAIGAYDDVEKCKETKKLRAGKGKLRNRRHKVRRGPLIVYANKPGSDVGAFEAFRNLKGVEVASVSSLNLLSLAPGGHVGRFIIFSESAFNALDGIFGTFTTASTQKKNYMLPQPTMANADITRIINSDEVQSVVNAKKSGSKKVSQKKNPLNNLNALLKLNPYAKTMKRKAFLFQEKRLAAKAATGKSGRAASFALARASEKKRNANAKAQSDKVGAITAKKAEITAGKAAKEQAKKDKKASK